MLYLATVSFSGSSISMAKGQLREISDAALVSDLTKAGYIVPYESTKKAEATVEDKADEKPKTKGKGKK